MIDLNVLYAEKCRLGLDLQGCRAQLTTALREAEQAARQAEKQRAHLQRRIDALIRKVRAQHRRLQLVEETVPGNKNSEETR